MLLHLKKNHGFAVENLGNVVYKELFNFESNVMDFLQKWVFTFFQEIFYNTLFTNLIYLYL